MKLRCFSSRALLVASFILAMVAPSARAQPSSPDPRAAIVQGVNTIAAPGSPGAIACWGDRALVCVVGKDDKHDVPVVACSHQGKGRVVLLAHTGYLDKNSLAVGETSLLLTNAVRWAGGQNAKLRVGVVKAKDAAQTLSQADLVVTELGDGWSTSLGSVDVLVLGGGLAPKEVTAVQKFIADGGGFITAQCGWGWRQNSGDKEMIDFSINHAVAPAGLSFTDGFAESTAKDGFDAAAVPDTYAHGGLALEIILSEAEGKPSKLAKKDQTAAGASAMRALRVLPESDRQFRPRIDALLKKRSDHLVPSEQKPLDEKSDPIDRFLLAYQVEQIRSLPPAKVRAHPAADSFPGKVPSDARTVSRTFKIDTSIPQWHSLGLYARPGDVIYVTLPAEAFKSRFNVRIGCHTDENWHHGQWKRVPQISRQFRITAPRTQAASAFGGLVYIDVPGDSKLGVITITVEGAVEAPLFELGKTPPAEWKSRIRAAPGPWAELATDKVIVSVPSERIRDLEDPTPVLEFWNQVLDAAADLATIPRERKRPERYVADVQISAGYMHSGYPIMTHLDAGQWLPSLGELSTGNWGLYHELGHNHQAGDWTFEGTGEVTCNLFTLYIHDTVCKDAKTDSKRWLAEREKDIAKYLAQGARFEQWKSQPFTALAMYIQLQQAFGWETFKTVFKQYRDLPDNERPHGEQAKRDQWLTRFSQASGKNLGPFFEAWGVPTSKSARDQISKLPAWMPEGWPPK